MAKRGDWSWSIEGWADDAGNHYNVEKGDREPLGADLPDVEYLQILIRDSGGDEYFTLHGPWEQDDWDFIADAVEYYAEYGSP